MFLCALIFIGVFFYALNNIFKNKEESLLLFIIFCLPIYVIALSVSLMNGMGRIVPLLQYSKEFIVLITLVVLILRLENKIKWHFFDKLVLAYLFFVFIYNIIPVGPLNMYQKLIATKSITFFCMVYFIGRLIPYYKINANKYFNFIVIVGICAGGVAFIEWLGDRHLQIFTGYTNFVWQFYNQPEGGHYGLTWTFEAESGIKRFASFFSMPLEHAASTIISIGAISALATNDDNTIVFKKTLVIAMIATLISIILAVSRASLVSYFLVVYFYALITLKVQLIKWIHYSLITLTILFLFYIKGDLYDFVINTISFSDSSSLTHIIAWTQGIESILSNPMGIGLGSAGNVANTFGDSLGGENELIIIGIQVGIIPMILYGYMYVYTIGKSASVFNNQKGKIRKIALFILLTKIGLIIPTLTSEAESYLYISYISWFFTGYLINLLCVNEK